MRTTIACSIDDAFRAFAASELAQSAEGWELDAIACWPWPTGFEPSADEMAAILIALRSPPTGRGVPHETLTSRPKSARSATKVAG
jgi:hypothetical protein